MLKTDGLGALFEVPMSRGSEQAATWPSRKRRHPAAALHGFPTCVSDEKNIGNCCRKACAQDLLIYHCSRLLLRLEATRLLFDRLLLQVRHRWDAVLVEREGFVLTKPRGNDRNGKVRQPREEFWLERMGVRCKQLTTARTCEYKWTATIKWEALIVLSHYTKMFGPRPTPRLRWPSWLPEAAPCSPWSPPRRL